MSLRFALRARLKHDGVVSAQEVPWSSQGVKREYPTTEAGQDALHEWMNAPLPCPRVRDAIRLKSAYFEWATPTPPAPGCAPPSTPERAPR